MSDPDPEKNKSNTQPPEPEKQGSFFFGGSIANELGLVFLAGFAFAAFQWGGDLKDRLAMWIDGELTPSAIVVSPERLALQEAGIISDDVIRVGNFEMNIAKGWQMKVTPNRVWREEYFERLRDPAVREYRGDWHEQPLIGFIPESYLIELPDGLGDIILLSKRILINQSLSQQELMDATSKAGVDNVIVATSSDFVVGGDVPPDDRYDHDKTLIYIGSVDPALMSKDDLFDHYFLDQLSTLFSSQTVDGPVEIKQIRNWSSGSYRLGMVDYVMRSGNARLSSVFYWHLEEGSSLGELGLFFALRKEPVESSQQKLFQTVSSLRLKDGDNQIWRGFDYDAPAEGDLVPFMHVELFTPALEAFGLDVRLVESALEKALPVFAKELEDIVVKSKGDATVLLKDVANVNSYILGTDDVLRTKDEIILTVARN